MCLSPVGLSTVTKLAPVKLVGIMMGVWFLAASLGSKLAGYLSGFFVANNSWQLTKLVWRNCDWTADSGSGSCVVDAFIKKLMG